MDTSKFWRMACSIRHVLGTLGRITLNILGVSFDYHDAAAALVVDGTVCAAAQEERFSRRKHDAALPKHAIAYCLAEARITAAELDAVAYYEQPLVKFDRIVKASLRQLPSGGWRYRVRNFAKAVISTGDDTTRVSRREWQLVWLHRRCGCIAGSWRLL